MTDIHIVITPISRASLGGNPPGKLGEAELHFTSGPLEGLKLIGFAIWERAVAPNAAARKSGAPKSGARNVTFPARQYTVNGERRSYALLRPVLDTAATQRLRDLILDAYAQSEAADTPTPGDDGAAS